ncbi:unnamed protein product [Brassica oleracea var. botrytis]
MGLIFAVSYFQRKSCKILIKVYIFVDLTRIIYHNMANKIRRL